MPDELVGCAPVRHSRLESVTMIGRDHQRAAASAETGLFMQHHHDHDSSEIADDGEPSAQRTPKQEQQDASTEVSEVAPGVVRTQLPISMPGSGT